MPDFHGPIQHVTIAGTLWLILAFPVVALLAIVARGGWRAVMFIGMNYILIAFGRDFVLHVAKTGVANQDISQLMNYLPFAALCLISPLLRIAAAQRRRGMRPASD